MKILCRALALGLLPLVLPATFVHAQVTTPATAQPTPAEQVVIERQALELIPAKTYDVSLKLKPSRYLTIIAPTDGIIFDLNVKVGDKTIEQSPLFQMDQRLETIQKNRAAAEVTLAEIKINQAKAKNDTDAQELGDAELSIAKLGLELAELRLQALTVRSEFGATVFRVHAQSKQFVTAKQPILELGDPSTMHVAIPVDRKVVKVGDMLKLTVEGTEVDAKIARIEAALDEFEPLRDLYESLATAYVEIDNRAGGLMHGQTVYAPLVPRETVTEIPNKAIAAAGDAQRKIQVLRDLVVRDIPVSVLAPVGAERSFVMGALMPGDELIVSSSVELADGTQVSRESIGGTPAAPGTRTTTPGQTPVRQSSGF